MKIPERLSSLQPAVHNPREITTGADQALGLSLARFGDLGGIVVNVRSGRLVGGHQRTRRLLELAGDVEIQGEGESRWIDLELPDPENEGAKVARRFSVRLVDLSEAEELAANLAANSPTTQGKFTKAVEDLVRELTVSAPQVVLDLDLDKLIRKVSPRMVDEPDPGEAKPVDSKQGTVYELGPHRLLCGDSIDPGTPAALYLPGELVDIILSDPPYCSGGFQEAGRIIGSIGSKRRIRRITSGGKGAEETPRIARDHLTTQGMRALLVSALGAVPCRGCCYVFSDWRQHGMVREAVEPLGYQFRGLLVWDKDRPGMGGPWRHQYELVFFGTRRKEPGQGKSGDVLRFARSGNPYHPTEKPVALLIAILENTQGELVADPFAGSGSTLIACAETGKVARLVEVDPAYCDVVRRRWSAWARTHGVDSGPGALE